MISKIGILMEKYAGLTPATLSTLRRAGARYTVGDKKYMNRKADELLDEAIRIAKENGYTFNTKNKFKALQGGGGLTTPGNKTIYLATGLPRKQAARYPLFSYGRHTPKEAKKLNEAMMAYHEALEAQASNKDLNIVNFAEFIPGYKETANNYATTQATSVGKGNDPVYIKELADIYKKEFGDGVSEIITVPPSSKSVGTHAGASVLAGETREISKMPKRIQRALSKLISQRLNGGRGQIPLLARKIGMNPADIYRRPLTDAEYTAMAALQPNYGNNWFTRAFYVNEEGNEEAIKKMFAYLAEKFPGIYG